MEIIKISSHFPSYLTIKKTIEEYQQQEQFPTFTGLLNKLGINWYQWSYAKPNWQTNKAVNLLLQYQQHLEAHIEKRIMYDKPNTYNFNSMQFILKKYNPEKYGDKTISSSKQNTFEMTNESGIDITKITMSN